MGFVKDLINNIGYARQGVAIDVRDPFKKRLVEQDMNERGIKFCKGFFSSDSATVYGIVSGKEEDVRWLLQKYMNLTDKPKYYISKHKWFRTEISTLLVE